MARAKKTAGKTSPRTSKTPIPNRREWLYRALIAAFFSFAGVVANDLYAAWRQSAAQEHAAAEASLAALQELSALLDESYRIFTMQNGQAQRLLRLLKQNHPRNFSDYLGYDETFYVMHDRFTRREATLQSLIRSTTMNSQRRVNLEMSRWLQHSPAFMYDQQPDPQRTELAAQLRILQLHLNQWHDKYDAWIPGDPKRSLVYLADEEAHGVGFPPGLEESVKEVIGAWAAGPGG